MLSSKEFQALQQWQKLTTLESILKEHYHESPILEKIYAYVTSELPKDDTILGQMYAWLVSASNEKNENDAWERAQHNKQLADADQERFDEKYFDDLLAKV